MWSLSKPATVGSWPVAVRLIERWLERGERVDALIESTGAGAAGREVGWGGPDRARCQHLLYGAVRNHLRLNATIADLVAHPPRARLRALLLVAGFELLEAATGPAEEEGQTAKIVHHAVAQAKTLLSPAEARLVNAVLRKLAGAAALRAPPPDAAAGPADLALYYSHPEWLVRRWLAHFGSGPTRSLLVWNQTPAPVHARWRAGGGGTVSLGSTAGPTPPGADRTDASGPPAWLQPTPWPGFYVVPAGHWPEVEHLLADGALYLQDPAALMAATLLDPQPGETVLDLCAAPGGKSLLLADLLAASATIGRPADLSSDLSAEALAKEEALAKGEASAKVGLPAIGWAKAGRVVAVDLPDERRIGRLKENLAKARGVDVALVQADVRRLTAGLWREHGLPREYAAVLLDVPCSNTGVMRHRVDVKWRLHESDIARHAVQQRSLLAAAARLITPGGRLVYSTCSLEPEENEGVVEAFLRSAGGRFVLEETRSSHPWESGCDGAGAFRLRRKA